MGKVIDVKECPNCMAPWNGKGTCYWCGFEDRLPRPPLPPGALERIVADLVSRRLSRVSEGMEE